MAAPDPPCVEVAYALAGRQRVVRLPFTPSMTAGEAVQASGLAREFPELEGRPLALGVFGRRVEAGQRLCPGDRVEIYRALKNDPRVARRAAGKDQQRTARNRTGTPTRRR